MYSIDSLPVWVFPLAVGILGTCVGSFLNVVIYRLPLMMERQWLHELADALTAHQWIDRVPELPKHIAESAKKPLSLLAPRSHCSSCQASIALLHNIPVVSWLWLRGRCTQCHKPFSIRYCLVELGTGLLSGLVAWQFGVSWLCVAALVLCWSLIVLAWIDWDTLLLPDSITLPLVWLGLLFNQYGIFTSLSSALMGAVGGYLFLWSVYWVFKYITGKEGMGYGDFKLLSALGAFLGWTKLPLILLLSSVAGALVGGILIGSGKHRAERPLPFGPYLAIAGIISLLWGDSLLKWYFDLF